MSGVTPDHSANFPHEYAMCGACGRKGVYWLRPLVGRQDGETVVTAPGGVRCKYCGRTKRIDGGLMILELEGQLMASEVK